MFSRHYHEHVCPDNDKRTGDVELSCLPSLSLKRMMLLGPPDLEESVLSPLEAAIRMAGHLASRGPFGRPITIVQRTILEAISLAQIGHMGPMPQPQRHQTIETILPLALSQAALFTNAPHVLPNLVNALRVMKKEVDKAELVSPDGERREEATHADLTMAVRVLADHGKVQTADRGRDYYAIWLWYNASYLAQTVLMDLPEPAYLTMTPGDGRPAWLAEWRKRSS